MAKKATPAIKGKTPVSKTAIRKAAAPKRAATKTVASGDDVPEAKTGSKAQQEAAEQLFTGADGAVRNAEQQDNHVRRQALGY